MLKIFKATWPRGLDIQARAVTKGQLNIWLNQQRARLKNSSFDEDVRFVRQLFEIALDHKAIGESPAAGFKELRVEKPIRTTPNREQFLSFVAEIRNQSLNASSNDSADLVEFM